MRAITGSISSRKRSFANRSGETSSRSISSSTRRCTIGSHSSGFVLLIVSARTPSRVGHLDLVAHQRQQRRDSSVGPGALLAQQLRGDEVDGALAPPRALHEQHAAARRAPPPRSPRAAPAGRRRRGRASGGGGRGLRPRRVAHGVTLATRSDRRPAWICGSRQSRGYIRRAPAPTRGVPWLLPDPGVGTSMGDGNRLSHVPPV